MTEPSVATHASEISTAERARTVLDFVREDLARLAAGLGPQDRSKLEEYLEAIRDIERRIEKAEARNDSLEIPLMERPSGVPDQFEDHAKLMMDLQVPAYQADMTRVITFMMGREGGNRSYPSIGVAEALC